MRTRHSVLIVDDHPMLRAGLKALLASSGDFAVAGEAGTAAEALRLAADLRPDLVTLDLSLPDQNGLAVIQDLLTLCAGVRILVISTHARAEYATAALRAGARGYLLKEAAVGALLTALSALVQGRVYLDEALTTDVPAQMSQAAGMVAETGYESLSRREQEVLRLVALGLSSKEIGARLFISPRTVENHRASVIAKLGLRNAVDIARYAAQFGLLDPEF